MTDLKMTIAEAIDSFGFIPDGENEEDFKFYCQELSEHILTAIGDTLGVTQEKLMTQLTAARTELQVERNRNAALLAEVRSLQTNTTAAEDD